ncbi:hypothetical protein Dimus_031190 [Dionaea muscipula]
MGVSLHSSRCSISQSSHHAHKIFLLCNYILIGSASSCIFLTLSLRLFPSVTGFLFILLNIITIVGAVSGCTAAASGGSNRWYAAHMIATVLTGIFQGSVSVLIFTTTGNFLAALKSYVKEDDGAVILKLAGGLCILMFCLEWVVLFLAFLLRYRAFVDGDLSSTNGQTTREEELKNWPWPFQV